MQCARVVPLFVLVGCGVSNPEFLPPPPGNQQPYPTFEVPGLALTHDALGLPACDGTLLQRDHYILCHDDDWLIARWVGYVLTPATLSGTTERTEDFRADPDLPAGGRAEVADYNEPTFDRGHMAPAGDFRRSHDAMSSTFLLSNIAAQYPELNQEQWLYLESTLRDRVRTAKAGWIFTGNLMLDSGGNPTQPTTRIGSNDVAVPTHCFKAVLLLYADDAVRTAGFVLPNRQTDIGLWVTSNVSIDALETITGVDFFDELPDSIEVEIEALNWSL